MERRTQPFISRRLHRLARRAVLLGCLASRICSGCSLIKLQKRSLRRLYSTLTNDNEWCPEGGVGVVGFPRGVHQGEHRLL
jgi:hypothetical protein